MLLEQIFHFRRCIKKEPGTLSIPGSFFIFVYNAVYLCYTDSEVVGMSKNTTYNIRIDSRIRKEADALYKSMGMSLSSAVNLFLTQSVIQRRLPIDDVIAEPLGEPPANDEYNSFESWEQAKEWLNA